MQRTPLVIAAALLLTQTPAAAADLSGVPSGTYQEDDQHAYVIFSYKHLGFSSPKVRFDDHLLGVEYFDLANHPTITFESTDVAKTGDDTYDVAGELTIKGKSLPVTLAATINGAGEHPLRKVPAVGVSATGTILRSDWGLDQYVPAVSDEVTLTIEVELLHREAQ